MILAESAPIWAKQGTSATYAWYRLVRLTPSIVCSFMLLCASQHQTFAFFQDSLNRSRFRREIAIGGTSKSCAQKTKKIDRRKGISQISAKATCWTSLIHFILRHHLKPAAKPLYRKPLNWFAAEFDTLSHAAVVLHRCQLRKAESLVKNRQREKKGGPSPGNKNWAGLLSHRIKKNSS